jgi:hypothetical protein
VALVLHNIADRVVIDLFADIAFEGQPAATR